MLHGIFMFKKKGNIKHIGHLLSFRIVSCIHLVNQQLCMVIGKIFKAQTTSITLLSENKLIKNEDVVVRRRIKK